MLSGGRAAQGSTKGGFPVELAFWPGVCVKRVLYLSSAIRYHARGRPRLATLIFAGIILLSIRGYGGSEIEHIIISCPAYMIGACASRVLISSFSSAIISSSVAHVECQLEPASCMHVRVRAPMRTNTQADKVEACSDTAPLGLLPD